METYVLTKAEIEACEGTEKSHYLKPQARRIDRSLGDLTGPKQTSLSKSRNAVAFSRYRRR